MIVAMKHLDLVCIAAEKSATLEILRGLGVVHFDLSGACGGAFMAVKKEFSDAEKAVRLILKARADSGDDSGELTAALLAAATKDALAELIRAKEGEGTRLLADIRMRMDLLKAALEQIIPLTAAMPKLMYEKLLARIKEWDFTTVDPDDDRFLRELVFYADKLDVTEEITRLKSHFQHFDQLTASAEPAGRQLDFMVQEIFREINTLGNKASCAEVSPLIVTMKTELEKIREQIQNIE